MDLSSTPSTPAIVQPLLDMQSPVPLDQLSPLFFGCLIAAIGLVYLFCRQKFNERSITGNDDFVYQLLPRELATNDEYSRGFMTYFGTMVMTVLLLSLIGPNNLRALSIPLPKDLNYAIVPLAIAFILIGVMPTVPGLLGIEKWLRKYAHEQAHIPAAALATAQRLSAADFDFSIYANEALESPELRGVGPLDFTRPRRSIEHDWARLSCLVYELKSRRASGVIKSLNVDLLHAYETDLENIEDKRRAMEAEVAAYRTEKTVTPTHSDEPLRRTIRTNLFKLYILLSCAVRLTKQSHGEIDLALRRFGFKLNQTLLPGGNGDLNLVGITVIAVCILLLGLTAVGFGQLDLWNVSMFFPEKLYQPFIDTASALIPHVAAIIIADLLRRRFIRRGTWFGANRRNHHAIPAKYIRVAAMCGIAGYLGLISWGFAFQHELTTNGALIDAPYALLAMATGGFYVYHLDNAELHRRPTRPFEIGAQTLVSGLCGLIAASVSFELIAGAASAAADRIVLTTATSAAVGFALACYLPMAAEETTHSPLNEAKQERLQTLQAAAVARFGDATKADAWLNTPHPALGGKSPNAAAADVEGFERAMALLQGPQDMAA